MRSRKLIGAIGLVTLVVFWPLFTLALGYADVVRRHPPVQVVVFIVFGLMWLIPAGYLIRWMQRPDR
jgi:hypothetical protein